ncbi:hypothetical protein FIV06_14875 [Labrenzia sp. THAF191b]|nr:hypothetical protein FIV06_14875 [Labrenzia sp. THAF191b]QFT05023.1 hypothetical protein FIV05_14870 [Labrenzia sp. THAF191a]QFT16567.1 hypothetical protein FIV03_14885 [Labrenzia sp. THAF187b]
MAALCSLIFLSACATNDERLRTAAALSAQAEASKELPGYPEDCRRKEASSVRIGEPLDVALIRTDQALGRANARVVRCGRWYDEIKQGYAGGVQ